MPRHLRASVQHCCPPRQRQFPRIMHNTSNHHVFVWVGAAVHASENYWIAKLASAVRRCALQRGLLALRRAAQAIHGARAAAAGQHRPCRNLEHGRAQGTGTCCKCRSRAAAQAGRRLGARCASCGRCGPRCRGACWGARAWQRGGRWRGSRGGLGKRSRRGAPAQPCSCRGRPCSGRAGWQRRRVWCAGACKRRARARRAGCGRRRVAGAPVLALPGCAGVHGRGRHGRDTVLPARHSLGKAMQRASSTLCLYHAQR